MGKINVYDKIIIKNQKKNQRKYGNQRNFTYIYPFKRSQVNLQLAKAS